MTTPLRTLIIEDSEDDAHLALRQLRQGGFEPQWTRVDSPDGLKGALETQTWDVIICDYSLPHLDAPEALKLVHASGRDIPFIIVSGKIGEDMAVEAMKAGAHDYVMKDRLNRLPAAVERELGDAKIRREHAQAKADLIANEQLVRGILENIQDAYIRVGQDGLILMVSPSAASLYGYGSMSEMIGLPALALYLNEGERRRLLTELRDHGGVRDYIGQGRRADGSLFWVSLNARPLEDQQGQAAGAECFVRDISERMRAEEELRESEVRYRKLFDASPDGIVIIGNDGCIQQANIAQVRMYGYDSPAEMIGLPAAQCVAPAARDYAKTVLKRRLAGEDAGRVEYELIRKDGSLFFGEVSATILRDAADAVLGYICVTHDTSERKRTEMEIREAKELLEAVVENVPLMIFLKESQDLRFVVFNRAGEELLGYDRKDLLGKNNLDLFPPEQAANFMEKDRAVLAGKEMLDIPEEPIQTLHRGTRLLHTRKVSIQGADGAPRFLLGISEDITERRRAEDELEKYRLHLEALVAERTKQIELFSQLTFVSLESASVGAWWIHVEEEDTFHALDTTARMLGIPVSQTPDKAYRISSWVQVLREVAELFPEYAGIVDKTLDQFMGTLCGKYEKYRVVYPTVAPDRTVRWIDARADVSARDGNGRALLMTGTLIDVTQMVEAEKALTAHKIHLETLVEERTEELALRNLELQATSDRLVLATRVAGLGIWDWDVVRDVLVWDDTMYKLYGLRREDFSGAYEAWSRHIHPDDKAQTEQAIQEALRGEREYAPEFRVVWPDGSVHYIQAAAMTFRASDNRPLRMIGVNIDVTERRHAAEARLRLEEQLRASQKMEAIGSLAGGVAHDFNNLLSVILNFTGFVMSSMADEDPRKADLVEVEKASERAVALTRQLLAFSRKQVLQPVPLDLNHITNGIEKMLRRILGEDIEFVKALATDLGKTLADPGQIEQVLMNLSVNARDAMPDGGRLSFTTSNLELDDAARPTYMGVAPGSYVEIAVADTGCGMDAATRERIFEPFFTTKEKGRGTGLGLSTVFGIVKQSGGEIRVESEPGRGTTFRILLPRLRGDEAAVVVKPKPAPSKSVIGGTETILVVEDEDGLRNVARRVLAEAGYTVLVAACGQEALSLCKEHAGRIHLVVTDVIMPEMSGRELAEQLTRTCPCVKVLFMSGYTHDNIVHHGVLDPAVHFLGKPFTAATLRQKIREVLDTQE